MLGNRILKIWGNYLKSQFVMMLFIGVLTYVVARLIGLPHALILAVIAGICEVIPNIGPVIATIPAGIIAYFQGSTVLTIENWLFALLTVLLYWLIQLAENWLIKPKIIGSMLNLSPLLALIGMTGFGLAFGVPGVLLAIPVMVSIREIVHYYFYEDREQD